MEFDQQNPVIQLCAAGMEQEGLGNREAAALLFMQAWERSSTEMEKFTSAHYLARHQKTIADKLKWDETALHYALQIKAEEVKGALPSLYLNIAKCYEDLGEKEKAFSQYKLALSFTHFLADDGYGKMIRSGIQNGLDRIS
ncbi:MAG: rRNA adenine methyltransferase [Bacteroidetes bacterium]|jgi:rifampin ADP-ribosylating transferase|nr:rRNA adenine methyltransferase [Bacteroidota bacterium]